MYLAVACGCGTRWRITWPGPSAITAPPTKLTANTASVNWIRLLRARSPSARYSPGAIVLGFIESANPIETTIPNKRSKVQMSSQLLPTMTGSAPSLT